MVPLLPTMYTSSLPLPHTARRFCLLRVGILVQVGGVWLASGTGWSTVTSLALSGERSTGFGASGLGMSGLGASGTGASGTGPSLRPLSFGVALTHIPAWHSRPVLQVLLG